MSLLNKLTRMAKDPRQVRKLADKAQDFARKNPDKVRKFADTANKKTGGKYAIDTAVSKVSGRPGHPGPGQQYPPYQPPR